MNASTGRPGVRTAEEVIGEWKGTCSTKHALLARQLGEQWPELQPRLVHPCVPRVPQLGAPAVRSRGGRRSPGGSDLSRSMEGAAVSRADAAQEIAAYLAGPVPEDALDDLRDLGVIGFANELAGITPETMRTLIAGARQKGRSWDEIGRRLDMTADEADPCRA
jgi:hypothetical protein